MTRDAGARLAVLAVFLVLGLVGLDRSPLVWADEVFYAMPAWSLVRDGHFAAPAFGAVRDLDEAFHLQPPLSALPLVPGFALAGPSAWTTRLPGLLGTALAGWLLMILLDVLSRSPRRALGTLAGALFLFAPATVGFARSGRPDGIALALLLGGTLACLRRRHGLGGALLGLGGLVHPVAGFLAMGPALAVLTATHRERLRSFATTALGVAAPLLVWGGWILLSTPGAWLEQFPPHIGGAAAQEAAHGLSSTPSALRPLAHLLSVGRTYPVLALLLLGAAGLRASRWGERAALALALPGLLLLFSAENFVKFFLPFWILAGLLGSRRTLERFAPRLLRLGAGLLLAQLLVAPALRTGLVLARWDERSYEPVRSLLDEHVPAGASLIGTPEVWYAAQERGSSLLYPEPMHRLRFPVSEADRASWRASVEEASPVWAVLTAGTRPPGFLEGRWSVVAEWSPEPTPFLGIRRPSYRLVLWERTKP